MGALKLAVVDHESHGLAWRETGTGSTVLFLHGLGGSRTAWEPQLAGLAHRWRCVAWDLPGYGASEPLAEMTFPSIARSIIDLLDLLDVERVALVGLSFGGMHALHAALGFPDRVAALALLDTSPAFGLDGTDPDEWKALRLGPLDDGVTPADMAPAVIPSVAGPNASDGVLAEAIASMARISPAGLRSAVQCLPSHDVRSRLIEISCPTLVISGELDTETPPAYSQRLADHITGAELTVIPGVGHLSNLEAPTAINSLLETFLSTALPSPQQETPT